MMKYNFKKGFSDTLDSFVRFNVVTIILCLSVGICGYIIFYGDWDLSFLETLYLAATFPILYDFDGIASMWRIQIVFFLIIFYINSIDSPF